MTHHRRRLALIPVLLLATTLLAGAQAPPAGQGRGGRGGAGQTVEKIRPLKPNLYMVTGGGANTLIRVTSEGLIVVDTKNPGDDNYNRLMEEIRSVSNLPVKWVINTQHHPDHVGTNQKFIDAGAQVLALEALKTHMASDPRTKAIPGRGEPKTRAEVEAYRTKFATVVTRASEAIKAGATRDTLAAQVKTDDLGWNFNAQFYGSLYDELTKK